MDVGQMVTDLNFAPTPPMTVNMTADGGMIIDVDTEIVVALAEELADVVDYITTMEVDADPDDMEEVSQWIIAAQDAVMADPAF